MEWELKAELVKLGNSTHESKDARKEFQSFVLKNIDQFDKQSWDMFSMVTDLLVDEMKQDLDYWTEIYKRLKNIDCNDEEFGFRSGMRIALMQTICEDELALAEKEKEAEPKVE